MQKYPLFFRLMEHSEDSLVGPLKHKVTIYCEELLKSKEGERVTSPYLMAMLVDLYKETGDPDCIAKALQMCKDLAEKHDKIRYEYWDFMADCIKQQSFPQISPCCPSSR